MHINTQNEGNVAMNTVFSDTQLKPTKKFEFQVTKDLDGVFSVCQKASRIYPCGREVVKSCKTWVVSSVADVCNSEFANSRQGRLLMDAINTGKVLFN